MKNQLPHICFFGCGNIAGRHAKTLKKPHAYHSEVGILAASYKKDIIIEKPITRNTKELAQLLKAVEKYGVRCTVSENYMYKPVIKKIKSIVDAGHIGKPLFIEVNKTNQDKITDWRTDEEKMGGGALLEGGIHWINFLVSIADSNPIGAIAHKPDIDYITDVPFEDSLIIDVNFENGVVGKLMHSWRIPNRFGGMGLSKIYGTDGVITFESNGLYCSLYSKKKKKKYFINPLKFLGFSDMLKALVTQYRDGEPWDYTTERITTELKLIESAYKSIKTKKIEKL